MGAKRKRNRLKEVIKSSPPSFALPFPLSFLLGLCYAVSGLFINHIITITRIFDVSADYLLELTPEKTSAEIDETHRLETIKEQQGLICDGSPLNDDETDLIAMYRLLPDYVQEDIFDLIYMQYKKHVEKKRVSIYSTYTKGKSGSGMDDEAHGGTA